MSVLKDGLSLVRLDWIETSPHQSYHDFESAVARTDVAVVLLAIRWSSHSFGNVRWLCERYGPPLVRLPAGLGVNRVAHEVVNQAGKVLSGRCDE